MTAPKAFVSYSHDSPGHKAWALRLASDLRAKGVDVVLDQWDLAPGQDVSLFMERGISEANRVLMICSSAYVEKAEAGVGGVGYERLIVTAEMVQSIDTIKFVPIVRLNGNERKTPLFLGPRLYLDFENDAEYEKNLENLVRELHGIPNSSKPPLGPNPFSGEPVVAEPARNFGPTGTLAANEKFLDNDWFSKEKGTAESGIIKLKLSGYMELRFGIIFSFSKSQIELLNAVRQSAIHTFGWPIGITLENVAEYRPRPYGDGIRAEVAIDDGARERISYDYWALRSNGDFYLLQSLFEDSRREGQIFFDTRIVRVTESLMFAENLYTKLGAPPEARVGIRVSHGGLAKRALVAASSNRHIFSRTSSENYSSSEIITVLGDMAENRVHDVRRLLEPMFMLFDFQQFDPKVYEDIVRKFERGRIG